VLFHSDAVQAVGKVPFGVDEAGVDLVSLTAHKMYGPKGVGALYVRRRDPRVELAPTTHGGGQERAVRSGTLNVPGIVGFGRAAEICREEMASEARRVGTLRDRLWAGLTGKLTDVALNGSMALRLPQNLNASFAGVEGESLLMGLTDIALSSGAACTSANREPSRVLKAIGLSDEMAYSALRFGLGRFTTAEEIDHVVARVVEVVTRLRAISPLAEEPGDDELAGVEWRAD
jgi:cysteine desulfurase